MAGERVPAVGPDGAPITLPVEKVPELNASGGHVVSPDEAAATDKANAERHATDTIAGAAGEYAESSLAGVHALQRGTLEAVGVPLDRGITGIADFVGGDSARKSTAAYLKGLDERHPVLTTVTGLEGNVAGAIGAAAALKVPGGIGAAPVAGARGVAARMTVGGIENVIQATTKDVNEAALGDKAVNGEMLVANMPKHFVVGSLLAGAFEGGAHLLGKGVRAVSSRAVPALEEGASKAVGRELGLEGEEAVAAGARVRSLNEGRVPTSRQGIADVLTGEQSAQRAAAAAEHAGAADALAGAQTTEAALLSARQEAARKAAAGAGRRGVATAETEAAEGTLDAAAGGGARVEAAELSGAARAAEVRGIADHFGAVQGTLSAEHAAATKSLQELTREHADVAKQLEAVIKRIGDGADGAEHGVARGASKADLIEYQAARKRGENPPRPVVSGSKAQYAQRPPRVGDIDAETGEPWTAERLGELAERRAATTGSESVQAEAKRLASLYDSLRTARDSAEQHLTAVTEAIQTNQVQAKQAIFQAAREAPVRSPAALKAQSAADVAKARVAEVEAETAAFVEKARGKGEGEVAKAEKRGAARILSAKADAEAARVEAEAIASKERDALAKKHGAEIKGLPEARTTTDVDPFIKGMADRQAAMRSKPLVSGHAAMGAGLSLLHGNPVAAVGALGSSFAAGQARNHGNLLAARTLRGLSTTLSSVDDAIRSGATSILTGASSKATRAATNDDITKGERKSPTFEELSKQLVELDANPLELEHRVRESVGFIAGDAPGTYQEILETTRRAHGFLLSILPVPQRDPNSLTPHLDPSDVGPTARYDFMRSAATIDDPLSVFADVEDGSITQTQVNAIQAVYPRLFDKMRNEVRRQTMYLTTPVDYERQIHVGVLLNQVTDEVLESDFQRLMRDSYADKSKQSESANESRGASGSKATKNMMSASESVEGGMP